MTKKQTGTAAALIGFAFLLGTAVIGCEKETTTTVPVPVAGEPGPAGAPGAPGADAAPPQASEKTSESSTTTKSDNGAGGSTTTTDKSATQKTN
jgi:hypothetical protein